MLEEFGWNIAAVGTLLFAGLTWLRFGFDTSKAPLACPMCEGGSVTHETRHGLKAWWCNACGDTPRNRTDGLY